MIDLKNARGIKREIEGKKVDNKGMMMREKIIITITVIQSMREGVTMIEEEVVIKEMFVSTTASRITGYVLNVIQAIIHIEQNVLSASPEGFLIEITIIIMTAEVHHMFTVDYREKNYHNSQSNFTKDSKGGSSQFSNQPSSGSNDQLNELTKLLSQSSSGGGLNTSLVQFFQLLQQGGAANLIQSIQNNNTAFQSNSRMAYNNGDKGEAYHYKGSHEYKYDKKH